MPTVRVFQRPDDSLVILALDSRDGDLDSEMERRPDLADLPYADVDADSLPLKDRACTRATCEGERHSVRSQWRLVDGAVVRDADAPNPERDAIHQRKDDLATLSDTNASVEAKFAAFARLNG